MYRLRVHQHPSKGQDLVQINYTSVKNFLTDLVTLKLGLARWEVDTKVSCIDLNGLTTCMSGKNVLASSQMLLYKHEPPQ